MTTVLFVQNNKSPWVCWNKSDIIWRSYEYFITTSRWKTWSWNSNDSRSSHYDEIVFGTHTSILQIVFQSDYMSFDHLTQGCQTYDPQPRTQGFECSPLDNFAQCKNCKKVIPIFSTWYNYSLNLNQITSQFFLQWARTHFTSICYQVTPTVDGLL